MGFGQMKISIASNHPQAEAWEVKYGWNAIETSSASLSSVATDVMILDFLQPYFHWNPKEWSDSVELRQIAKHADCIVRQGSLWVGRSLMRSAGAVLFSHFGISYQPLQWVYLSGFLESCQSVIAILFDQGYRNFRLLDWGGQEEYLESKIRELQKNFISLNAERLPMELLVLQKPLGNIFVHSQVKDEYDENLRQTISYFNFLATGGLVINLCSASESWLRSEALATNLKYLSEKDFYHLTEWQVLKQFCQRPVTFKGLYD